MTRPARQEPAAVKVRLFGERTSIDTAAAVLAAIVTVLDRSGPRPNRYDSGQRFYLTVRTGPTRTAGLPDRT
jgi:hypothetical protein